MTGIAAIVSDTPDLRDRLASMSASLESRPHDTCAAWINGTTGLAAAVLETTAESLGTGLPLKNEDGSIALVLDGYLANYEELRRDLTGRGVRLRNASDAELVLRAYERWGEGCTAHLDGEYAIIVADRRSRTLFCARDHQGLKPLYYLQSDSELLVASDIATILAACEHTPRPNTSFLAQIVAVTIAAPQETAWQGVMRVPGASQLVFREGRVTLSRHYCLPTEVTRLKRSPADCIAEYRHMLSDAVRRASRTHRPLAMEVSGGLDSSALFGLASGLSREGKLLAPAVSGYTLRAADGSLADEVEFARSVALHLGVQIKEIPLFEPPLEWFARQTAIERDIATYPNGAMSIGIERQMVEDGARVSINGNGGDQWLDGSRGYVEQNLLALQWCRLLRNAREHIASEGAVTALPKIGRRAILSILPDRVRNALRNARANNLPSELDEVDYLDPALAHEISRLLQKSHAIYPADPVARAKLQVFDSSWTHFAGDIMNRQRARLGIEGRSPMLSRQFIEFCSSLPEDMKLRGSQRRWLHRRAMRGILPETVVQRTTKAEFPACHEGAAIKRLFEGDMPGELAEIINLDALRDYLATQQEGQIGYDNPFAIWGLFIVHQFALENPGSIG